MKSPIEIFGQELLDQLGEGPRKPFYLTEGRDPLDEECIDYKRLCYRGTENKKPNRALQINITIDEFINDQSILKDLDEPDEELRKIFIIERKYLWVIDSDYEIKILPERTQNVDAERGYICHTNITAGEHARHGGELWYGQDNIIFINNYSGRFYTMNAEEWAAVIKVFITAGYTKVVDIDLKKKTEAIIHE